MTTALQIQPLHDNRICKQEVIKVDIPGLSMALSQTRTMNAVGTAVLAKSLDTLEATGEQMVDMMAASMELSVNPAVGANINLYV